MKRWQKDNTWYVIQHCRWCDKWQRKTIELSDVALKSSPVLTNEKFAIVDPSITKEDQLIHDQNKQRIKSERIREEQKLHVEVHEIRVEPNA